MSLHAKTTMSDMGQLKRCLIKYNLDLNFCIVYFHLWFPRKSDLRISCLQETIEKLSELTTFRIGKFTFLIRVRVVMVLL